jgi:hypothetical protein
MAVFERLDDRRLHRVGVVEPAADRHVGELVGGGDLVEPFGDIAGNLAGGVGEDFQPIIRRDGAEYLPPHREAFRESAELVVAHARPSVSRVSAAASRAPRTKSANVSSGNRASTAASWSSTGLHPNKGPRMIRCSAMA